MTCHGLLLEHGSVIVVVVCQEASTPEVPRSRRILTCCALDTCWQQLLLSGVHEVLLWAAVRDANHDSAAAVVITIANDRRPIARAATTSLACLLLWCLQAVAGNGTIIETYGEHGSLLSCTPHPAFCRQPAAPTVPCCDSSGAAAAVCSMCVACHTHSTSLVFTASPSGMYFSALPRTLLARSCSPCLSLSLV